MSLLSNMEKLGAQAKWRYIFGASGFGYWKTYAGTTVHTTAFDCSGLVWAAMKLTWPAQTAQLPRFYTDDMLAVCAKHLTGGAKLVQSHNHPGAIVLWETHVGDVVDGDKYFSAYNTATGIHMGRISTTLAHSEPAPKFYDFVLPAPPKPPSPPSPYGPLHGATWYTGTCSHDGVKAYNHDGTVYAHHNKGDKITGQLSVHHFKDGDYLRTEWGHYYFIKGNLAHVTEDKHHA